MQRERLGRDELFGMGDSFGSFRGFGVMPSLFGDRDPFDDPFFTRPFGSLFQSSRFEQSPSFATREVIPDPSAKALVIEELPSDDEGETGEVTGDKKNEDQMRRRSSEKPSVEHPDDDDRDHNDGRSKGKVVSHGNERGKVGRAEPQGRNFSFQSCKVTYGGIDGPYYTSTRTRRAGSDGVMIEETKEANKTTGQATHKISRGIHDKGHSVTRKLQSDGKVDTTQTLHNLNEDELTGFEEAWGGNFRGPFFSAGNPFDKHGTRGSSSSDLNGMRNWGGLLLPSNAGARGSDSVPGVNSSGAKTKKVIRINID